MMKAKHRKAFAAAALWGACAWFLSLDVDFLVDRSYDLAGWLRASRALFVGVMVAGGYSVVRAYQRQHQRRILNYAELRAEIHRILAKVLEADDQELIYELRHAIQHMDKVINDYAHGQNLKSRLGKENVA